MKRFSALGVEWDITINIDAVRRIKGATGLELTDLQGAQGGDRPLVLRLQDEMTTFLSIAWVLMEKQAGDRKYSRADFEARWTTEPGAMAALEDAFWQEYADFFRPCRPVAARIIENLRSIQPPPDGTKSASDSQASSEPTPAPGPSANSGGQQTNG